MRSYSSTRVVSCASSGSNQNWLGTDWGVPCGLPATAARGCGAVHHPRPLCVLCCTTPDPSPRVLSPCTFEVYDVANRPILGHAIPAPCVISPSQDSQRFSRHLCPLAPPASQCPAAPPPLTRCYPPFCCRLTPPSAHLCVLCVALIRRMPEPCEGVQSPLPSACLPPGSALVESPQCREWYTVVCGTLDSTRRNPCT
eukprot:EG_transcript_19273